jgi:hypothetical protein
MGPALWIGEVVCVMRARGFATGRAPDTALTGS